MIWAYYTPFEKGNHSEAVYQLLHFAYKNIFDSPMPRIDKTVLGKPWFPAQPDIFFSLSHTSTHVLCAVSDKPIGADVERVRSVSPRLPERVCSPKELQSFSFFDAWVLKESFIKTYGDNQLTVAQVEFSLRDDTIVTPSPNVHAKLYSCIPGCAAALCAVDFPLPKQIICVETSKISCRS